MGRVRGNRTQLSLAWNSGTDRPASRPMDRTVLVVTYMLALIGLIIMFSASGVMAETRYGDSTFFLKRQSLWLLLGLLALHWVAQQDYNMWKTLTPYGLVLTFVLLVLVLIPFLGTQVNGARRWRNSMPRRVVFCCHERAPLWVPLMHQSAKAFTRSRNC